MIELLILAELRNLRRYAFCVLGNRSLSDIAVEAALNTVVSEVLSVSGRAVSRLDLYRKVNEATKINSLRPKVTVARGSGIQSQFLRLAPLHRQVASLRAVVGLPHGDIASIMDMPEEDVRRVYAESLDALRDRPIAVLIIEDEMLIADELNHIVTSLGLSVVGMAKNRIEALHIAAVEKPQLILADYQLRGDTGVEVVRAIREQMETKVIYVTAHPEAIRASGNSDCDTVITKPFQVREIERAVKAHLAA